jgi:hypothetical protein
MIALLVDGIVSPHIARTCTRMIGEFFPFFPWQVTFENDLHKNNALGDLGCTSMKQALGGDASLSSGDLRSLVNA